MLVIYNITHFPNNLNYMIKLYNNNCLKIITNDTNRNSGKITVPESR